MSDIPEFGVYKGMMTSYEESLKMSKVDESQVTHREACEKIADMQVDSMTTEELKQWIYEDLTELMFNCNDTFEWYAEKWEMINE